MFLIKVEIYQKERSTHRPILVNEGYLQQSDKGLPQKYWGSKRNALEFDTIDMATQFKPRDRDFGRLSAYRYVYKIETT